MKIKIYQINGDRDKNRVKFTRHDLLEKYQGTSAIDASLYDEVFSGDVECSDLEGVYTAFNTQPQPLHRGHSLSVSDIVVNEDGLTSRENVYAGGDAVTGQKFAIDAIAAGKEGAISLHRFVQKATLTIGRNRRQCIELDKKKLQPPEPIRSFGMTEVAIRLHPKVTGTFTVHVVEE